MLPSFSVTTVRTFHDFDLWLGHAVSGRSNRHQLWLGRPGTGKTARLHRHVRNTVGTDDFPGLPGRVAAPIYTGRITPPKWYVRGWQHRLERLLCLNDVTIHTMDLAWESLLLQFLERPGHRTIRWDLKAKAELDAADRQEIARYLDRHGLLEQFLRDHCGTNPGSADPYNAVKHPSSFEPWAGPGCGDAEVTQEEAEEAGPTVVAEALDGLVLPRSYETSSTVILVANTMGGPGWERIYSRLKVFVWDPSVDEQIADLRTWDPPLPGAVLGVIESCHQRGEVLNLDYRAVLNAADDLRLGMPWEDALRASFFTPGDQRVQEDASDVLDWLLARGASAGQSFTERDMYQEVGSLRGETKKGRRTAALDYLTARGWVERFQPPTVLRPGARGRRPGPSFRVLRLPEA